jgi:hypothetical protein
MLIPNTWTRTQGDNSHTPSLATVHPISTAHPISTTHSLSMSLYTMFVVLSYTDYRSEFGLADEIVFPAVRVMARSRL